MKHREKRLSFSVWVDGSTRKAAAQTESAFTGAGWIVKSRKTGEHKEFCKPLPYRSGSSAVAEFAAAAAALAPLPKGSNIRFHSDSQAVINYLREGRLPSFSSTNSSRDLALDQAAAALSGRIQQLDLNLILPERKRKRSDQTMINRAHNLAQGASAIAMQQSLEASVA